MTVPITFACGLYDRTLPLFSGEVKPEGIDFTYKLVDDPRNIFDNMSGHLAYDASELSLSEYICRMDAGQCPFIAIPVFLSRLFRHGFIFINKKSGIRTPKDLEGKRIGTPIYTSTAMVYMRAFLQHDYGVDLAAIRWVEGELNAPGWHADSAAMPLLEPVAIEHNSSDKGLSKLLESGELDGVFSMSLPACYGRHPDVARLFPNYREVELEYYQRTGIFPIMHLLAIRRDLHEAHPFVAASLYQAFSQAKTIAMDKLLRKGASLSMLPWGRAEGEAMQKIFGEDFWPYGVAPNRPTLEALMRYLTEQAMIKAPLRVEDLFAPV